MSTLKKVFEARRNAVEELRALYDAAEGRALSAEETEKEERIHATIMDLEKREARLIELDASERSAEEARAASGIPAAEGRKEEAPSERAALEALRRGEVRAAEIGYEARDLSKGTATDGPELVPTTLYNQLLDLMVETSPILRVARILRTAGGEDLVFPRVTSHSAASLIAEGGSIGESDPQFNTITLNAFKFGFSTQITAELEQDAAFNVAGYVVEQGGRALGRGLDAEFVSGSGSGRPNGVDNATVGRTTAAVAAVTMDELLDTMHSVIGPQRTNAVWMFRDSTILAIRKLKDTTNQYLWQPSTQVGAPDTLLGKPVYADPNLAAMGANAVFGVFGDMSGFYVRLAGGVRVERSVDFAFANDLVTYRFLARADSDIVDTTAIRTIRNAAS